MFRLCCGSNPPSAGEFEPQVGRRPPLQVERDPDVRPLAWNWRPATRVALDAGRLSSMLHLRLIVPADLAEDVLEFLRGDAAVTNVVVLRGAAQEPAGDVLLCDVAREGASAVLETLRELGVDKRGSIAVENVDISLSEAARQAAKAAPGHHSDAVVWEEVEARTHEETTLSVSYLVFMTVATMIAGIGVLLDQPILIVGAMVVGPEFGPLAGLCVALVQRRAQVALRSSTALLVGFPVGMLGTVLLTWLMTWWGLFDRGFLTRDRPLTEFIWQPDALSWIVAFLAGVAGMLSLTSAKSGALVGVLISVTTVPAAANVAVAIAYGVWDEASGSAVQLVLNVSAIIVAGTLTLLIQRFWWSRRDMQAPRTARSAAIAGAAARRFKG
jgi:uncharacterized hydrophobic protein (TIGR00271 family)